MQGSRTVIITLDEAKQRIVVTENKKVVRCIDLSRLEKAAPATFMLSADVQMKLMLIRVPKEYDMVRTLLALSEANRYFSRAYCYRVR